MASFKNSTTKFSAIRSAAQSALFVFFGFQSVKADLIVSDSTNWRALINYSLFAETTMDIGTGAKTAAGGYMGSNGDLGMENKAELRGPVLTRGSFTMPQAGGGDRNEFDSWVRATGGVNLGGGVTFNDRVEFSGGSTFGSGGGGPVFNDSLLISGNFSNSNNLTNNLESYVDVGKLGSFNPKGAGTKAVNTGFTFDTIPQLTIPTADFTLLDNASSKPSIRLDKDVSPVWNINDYPSIGYATRADTILPPGYYNKLSSKDGGNGVGTRIYLDSGSYYFEEIDMANWSQIIFIQPEGVLSKVYVRGNLSLNTNGASFFGPSKALGASTPDGSWNMPGAPHAGYDSTFSGGSVLLYTHSSNPVSFGTKVNIWASVLAPNADVSLGDPVFLFGQLLAKSITLENWFDGGGTNGRYIPIDPPVVEIDPSTFTSGVLQEKDGTPTNQEINITLDKVAVSEVKIRYCFSEVANVPVGERVGAPFDNSPASPGSDFNFISGNGPDCQTSQHDTLTIPIGQTVAATKKPTLSIVDDGSVEEDEGLYIFVEVLTGAILDGGAFSDYYQLAIIDNDANLAPTAPDTVISINENPANNTILTDILGDDTVDSEADSVRYTILYTIDNEGDTVTNAVKFANDSVLTTHIEDHFNYEDRTSMVVYVEVSDGSKADTATVTININDVDEAPVWLTIPNDTIPEDTLYSIDLSAYTSDQDAGATLVYSVNGASKYDSIVGSIYYFTPQQSDVGGPHSISLRVTDTNDDPDLFSDTSFEITVTNTEDPLVFTGTLPDFTALEDFADSINHITWSDYFSDEDGGTISINLTGSGIVAFSGTANQLDISSVLDKNGRDSIIVEAISGADTILTHFIVDITPVNDDPILAALSNIVVDQGDTIRISLSGSDVDLGDSIFYYLGTASVDNFPSMTIDSQSGEVLLITTQADVGTNAAQFGVQDRAGVSHEQAITITVNNLNDVPEVGSIISDTTTLEDSLFTYQIPAGSFTDADGEVLTWTSNETLGWLAFDGATRTFSGTPLNADVGATTIRVTVTDSASAIAFQDFVLTVVNTNDAPVLDAVADQVATEDSPYGLSLTGTDVDVGDAITYTKYKGPTNLTISTLGVVGWTPTNSDVGIDSVYVIGTDPSGAADTLAFQITVANTNDTPEIGTAISDTTTIEDEAFTYVLPASAFTDPDGDLLTWSVLGAPTWLSFTPGTRTLTGTPENADVGTMTLTVQVEDPTGESISQDFDLTVTNANDAPTFASSFSGSVIENSLPGTELLTVVGTDVDLGDVISYSLFGSAEVSIDPITGLVTLVNAPDFETNDTISVSVVVTDLAGAADTTSMIIEITNELEPPAVNVGPYWIDENSPAGTVVDTIEFDNTSNFPTSVFTLVSGGTGDSLFELDSLTGEIKVASGALLDYESTSSYTLIVSAKNSDGVAPNKSITISLNDLNEAPTIADQTLSIPENTPGPTTVGTVISSDPENNQTYSLLTDESGLFNIDSSTGLVTVASELNYEVQDVYLLVVVAGDGEFQDTSTVTVNVTDENDAPVIETTEIEVPENTVPGTVVDTVVATDEDPSDTVTYEIINNPGDVFEIDSITGEITIIKEIDYETTPEITITIKVTDGTVETEKEVTIKVGDSNDAPTGKDTTVVVVENTLPGESIGQVPVVDQDGDALTYVISVPDYTIDPITGDPVVEPGYAVVIDSVSGDTTVVPVVIVDPITGEPEAPNGYVVVIDPVSGDTTLIPAFTVDLVTGEVVVAPNYSPDYEANEQDTIYVEVSDGEFTTVVQVVVEVQNVIEKSVVEINVIEDIQREHVVADSIYSNQDTIWVDVTEDGVTKVVAFPVVDGENELEYIYHNPTKDEADTIRFTTMVNKVPPEVKPELSELGVDSSGVVYTNDIDEAFVWVVSQRGKDPSEVELTNTIVRPSDLKENQEVEVIVTYQDIYGNEVQDTIIVKLDTIKPDVKIVSPSKDDYINSLYTEVEWTVDGTLQNFELGQNLAINRNSIIRSYTDLAGNVGSDTIEVLVELTDNSIEVELEESLIEEPSITKEEYYQVKGRTKIPENETFNLGFINHETELLEEVIFQDGVGSEVIPKEDRLGYDPKTEKLGVVLIMDFQFPQNGGTNLDGTPRGGVCEDGTPMWKLGINGIKVVVYDNIGQYVTSLDMPAIEVDGSEYQDDGGKVRAVFEISRLDREMRSVSGQLWGSGVYLINTYTRTVAEPINCNDENRPSLSNYSDLKKAGYKRRSD